MTTHPTDLHVAYDCEARGHIEHHRPGLGRTLTPVRCVLHRGHRGDHTDRAGHTWPQEQTR